MAIKQSTLKAEASTYREVLNEDFRKKASKGPCESAFLCHSHKDEILVKGLIAIFQKHGIELYVDWKDHSMPETPNVETARRIQAAINSSTIFLFLATANSKSSRWCPWEIGFADAKKGPHKVYIIPTTDGADTYGNEYLGLYPKIDETTTGKLGKFAVGSHIPVLLK